MIRSIVGFAVVSLSSVLGCSAAPTAPSESQGLSLEGAITESTLEPGQFAELVFRLKNLSAETASIEFPNSCRIEVYVETTGGRVVLPSSGVYACADVVTVAALPPGAEITQTVTVFGDRIMQAIYSGTPLPEGRYRAYATVNANLGKLALRSPYVYLEVR